MNDQTRNLNPTLEAKIAMIVYGRRYSEQRGGSMDFWDSLSNHDKDYIRKIIEIVQEGTK